MKPLGGPTEMQFLRNGDEVRELPEFHVVDGTAGICVRRSLRLFGDKSWTKTGHRC